MPPTRIQVFIDILLPLTMDVGFQMGWSVGLYREIVRFTIRLNLSYYQF